MSSANKKNPVFYYMLESAHCRAVIAVARILGVELELKLLDLTKKEQLNPEFVKVNPFHVIPTLVDLDDFVVWESRVICTYLIQSRSNKNNLYPVDLKTRTNVDKILQYDLGTLFRAISDGTYTAMQVGDIAPKIEKAKETLQTLEEYLTTLGDASNSVAGGAEMSLADIFIHFTLTYLDVLPGVELKDYPKVCGLNTRVEQFLEQYQKEDGLFDKGREAMKRFVAKFQEKQK